MLRSLAVAILLVISGNALATALAPFSAEFRIHVNRLPTPVKAELTLEPVAGQEDYYRMSLEASSFLLNNREESRFHWRQCEPRTDHYEHTFRGFGQRRAHQMAFDWEDLTVTHQSGDESSTFAIPANTLDEMTILLKGRCVFATGDREYSVTSAYGKRLRTHHFIVTDMDTLDTPMGELDTLVVVKKRDDDSERRTLFWVAPSLDYMVVQARHIESPRLYADLVMIDYKEYQEDEL